MTSQYISVREAAQLLIVSEKKIMDLIEDKELQSFRIAGQFLRLKKADVMQLRNQGAVPTETIQYPYTFGERLRDFFYFNDFYMMSFLFIGFLLFLIFNPK